MKNELIKITTNEKGNRLVSARELYFGLGMDSKKWSRWRETNINNNEFFLENKDWTTFPIMVNGNESVDFAISLEFAKHLAMQSRTEKSHEYRNYFIQCEKTLQEVSKKALLLEEIYNGGQRGVIAAKQLTEIEVKEATKELTQKIEEDKPLVEFSNTILSSSDSIQVGEFAKLVKDENINIGRNRLFQWLRDNKYLMKDNKPYQNRVEQGLFELEEYVYNTPYKSGCIGFKTLITGKGQVYLVEKLRKEIS